MTNARQLGAYPSLIPGNQQGAEDSAKQWDVIELDDGLEAGAAATSKVHRLLKLPKIVLQHDIWIRYHELTHVERPIWEAGKNQLRNLMRQMLEEVALDGQCLLRDGIDLRYARDFYDWSKRARPDSVYKAAANFFQVWTSAQVSKDAELLRYLNDCKKILMDAEATEAKLAGLEITLWDAAEGVFNDYSSGNCEDWADIVTAKLLGVPKEEIPDAPDPTGGATGQGSSSGAGAGLPENGTPAGGNGAEDPAQPADEGEQPGAANGSAGREQGGDSADDSSECQACSGEGVDEDDNECTECSGTGTVAGGQDDLDGGQESGDTGTPGEGEGDPGPEGDAAAHSEWDTPPVELGKDRQNGPMEFGFDPLAKTQVDPNSEPELPPVKASEAKARETITQEQLQEAIDQERVNRKQGESSLADEITAKTPHGAVDVHRHTLNKGTSQSVALGWRSSEMGATVRYPSQLFQGGRVFAKRAPGGSIILDGSGSMQWHAQHIMEAQKVMPNLYVAVYSHHGSAGYWRASHNQAAVDTFIARYCVLAAKGQLDPEGIEHKSEEWQHTGGNSGSDPASLWYAARWAPKPIVWVSDGMVSFGESQQFYKQCDAIMRQHKIVRVLTIEDAIDYLTGKAVPGWHQSATVDTHWVRLGQPYMGRSADPKTTMSEAGRWTQLRANSKRK